MNCGGTTIALGREFLAEIMYIKMEIMVLLMEICGYSVVLDTMVPLKVVHYVSILFIY
jgi:hypothetical protein